MPGPLFPNALEVFHALAKEADLDVQEKLAGRVFSRLGRLDVTDETRELWQRFTGGKLTLEQLDRILDEYDQRHPSEE